MAKQRPTWAKRMKELQQMERKNAKAARRAAKREEEGEELEGATTGTDEALNAPMDPESRAEMFDGLF